MLVSSEDCFVLSSPYRIKKMRPVSLRTGGFRKSYLSFQFKNLLHLSPSFVNGGLRRHHR